MKKIIISFIILLFFSSCMSTYRSYTIVVDYSRYAANGFFITESNSVSFEYMPVGSVIAHVSGSMKTSQGTRYVTAEDALAEFVYKCKEMRANGAINVEIYVERDKGNIVGYRTTGMAVRMPGRLIKNNE